MRPLSSITGQRLAPALEQSLSIHVDQQPAYGQDRTNMLSVCCAMRQTLASIVMLSTTAMPDAEMCFFYFAE